MMTSLMCHCRGTDRGAGTAAAGGGSR